MTPQDVFDLVDRLHSGFTTPHFQSLFDDLGQFLCDIGAAYGDPYDRERIISCIMSRTDNMPTYDAFNFLPAEDPDGVVTQALYEVYERVEGHEQSYNFPSLILRRPLWFPDAAFQAWIRDPASGVVVSPSTHTDVEDVHVLVRFNDCRSPRTGGHWDFFIPFAAREGELLDSSVPDYVLKALTDACDRGLFSEVRPTLVHILATY